MRKATKHQDVQNLTLKFDGGLNYAQAAANILDNELTRGLNIVYNSQTGTPETRPGTTCLMAAVCDSTNPILMGYYYEKTAALKYHIGVCNGKLYYRSGATLNAWTEIGALNDTTTVPSMITFNGKLLIADGGTNIKRWDGTTYDELADGLSANALTIIKNRVVANSTTSPDLVTLTGAEDETHWNTATEGAVGLRAGYGDNMTVKGFSVFGDDLIVFKKGDSEKRIYRINVADSTTTNWYVSSLTTNNTAQNAHCAVSAFNNVYFVDTNGFKSLKGVTEYGDLQVDMTGSKVNSLFGSSDCDQVAYVPLYTSIWYLISERVFCYFRLRDTDGNIKDAFTELMFKFGRVRYVYQAEDTIYLCGHDGFLYKLDESEDTDATDASTREAYQSIIQSKQFSLMSEGILRKTQVYLTTIKSGTCQVAVITPSATTNIETITLTDSSPEVNDMTDTWESYTDTLYEMGESSSFSQIYNRIRGRSIQFQLTTTSGRCGFEGLKAEIAVVGN